MLSNIIYENEIMNDEKILYSVTVCDLQAEAERIINRKLTIGEILHCKKLIEFGLNTSIEIVLDSAINESIK